MTGPRKSRVVSWREMPPARRAAHLLATPTITDRAWTSKPRLPREKRSDFVRRILLGETPSADLDTPGAALDTPGRELDTPSPAPDTHEAEAAEPASVRRGYYFLNADGQPGG